jgi:hypothetical protein
VGFTSARTITASANPPRSVFLDLPLGHTTGLPGDREGQRRILSQGLTAAAAMTEPGSIHDLDFRFVDDDWKAEPLSWSRKRQERAGSAPEPPSAAAGESLPADTRTPRSDEPVYQTPEDAAAAAQVDWDSQCLVCIGLAPPE